MPKRGALAAKNAQRSSAPRTIAERTARLCKHKARSSNSIVAGAATLTPLDAGASIFRSSAVRLFFHFVLDMEIRFGMGRSREPKINSNHKNNMKTGNGNAPRESATSINAERLRHRSRSFNIANLPAEIRDELNYRINDGDPGEPSGVGVGWHV